MGTVYLLNEINLDGTPSTLYKIGKTKHEEVSKRSRGYKAGNARELRCIYQIEVDDAQATETALHHEFVGCRIVAGGGDEWFEFQNSDIPIRTMDQFGSGTAHHPNSNNKGLISDLFTWAILQVKQNKAIAGLAMAVTTAVMGPKVAIAVMLIFVGMVFFVMSDAPAAAK